GVVRRERPRDGQAGDQPAPETDDGDETDLRAAHETPSFPLGKIGGARYGNRGGRGPPPASRGRKRGVLWSAAVSAALALLFFGAKSSSGVGAKKSTKAAETAALQQPEEGHATAGDRGERAAGRLPPARGGGRR